MRCPAHPDEHITGICGRCDEYVCKLDSAVVNDTLYCTMCSPQAVGQRAPRGRRGRGGRTHRRAWQPFATARSFVRSLGLRSNKEWRLWVRGGLAGKPDKPSDVPAEPGWVYAEEWQGWQDWLGHDRGRPRRPFRPFEEARAFVRAAGIASETEWRLYARGKLEGKTKPDDIPSCPQRVYRDQGWTTWGEWLGTFSVGRPARDWRPFVEARTFARALGFQRKGQWYAFARGELPGAPPRPTDIPCEPARTYGDEFTSWGDFLGNGHVSPLRRTWRPFQEARAFVRNLGLATQVDYERWARGEIPGKPPKPEDIPANPGPVYGAEWRGAGDWLGTGRFGNRGRTFRPWDEAKALARSIGITTRREWLAWVAGPVAGKPPRPADIPAAPEKTYADRWQGWADFFGTGPPKLRRSLRPFEDARAFARSLGLPSGEAWKRFMRGQLGTGLEPPTDLPIHPWSSYRGRFKGWADFLGPSWTLRRQAMKDGASSPGRSRERPGGPRA